MRQESLESLCFVNVAVNLQRGARGTYMRGWIILFALLSLLAAIPGMLGSNGTQFAMKAASSVFGILFLASVLTQLVRGRP